MYGWLRDPQMRKGRFCRVCKCEFFGEGEVCERCWGRLRNFEFVGRAHGRADPVSKPERLQ